MAPTTTPVRPSMTRAQRDRLTSDLRMACMRISRRVRFESTAPVAPHQFSVLVRLEEQVRTPKELAAIEKVSAPEHDPHGRRPRRGRPRGARGRPHRRPPGDPVADRPRAARTIRDIRRRRDQWFAVRLERLTDDERALLAQATALLERVAAE